MEWSELLSVSWHCVTRARRIVHSQTEEDIIGLGIQGVVYLYWENQHLHSEGI